VSGILNIAKPAGMTSFRVVHSVRRITGIRHVGHAGTLDPAAEGVLPVCLNQATRLIEYMHGWSKTYEATVHFGYASDTGDRDGMVQPHNDSGALTGAQVEQAMGAFRGQIQQVPPMFSALKHDGRPLYELARRGETVERQPRTVHVHRLDMLSFEGGWPAVARLRIECSTGTYIRALAMDLGQALGVGAYLQAMTRVAYGRLGLADAVPLERLQAEPQTWMTYLLPMDTALSDLPALTVVGPQEAMVLNGRAVRVFRPAPPGTLCRVHSASGRLLALGHVDQAGFFFQPAKVLTS
jgi:tRNA pseudouridine55 synthase